MQSKLDQAQTEVDKYSTLYRRVYDAMQALGLKNDSDFRVLQNADLLPGACGDAWDQDVLGQGRQHISWIWTVGESVNKNDPTWSIECLSLVSFSTVCL